MKTVEDAMNEWIKRWEESRQKRWDDNGWHKEDDLGAELNVDYWDNPKYTGNMDWCKRLDNLIIKNAETEGKIYDIDRLFWDDGKLFGYDTYFKNRIDCDGATKDIGPFTKIKADNKEYEVLFCWEWDHCCLVIHARPMESINTLRKVPLGAQREIGFDMLFGVNPGVVKIMIHKAVTELITYFKSKEGEQ